MGEVAAVKQSSQDIVRYNTDFSKGIFGSSDNFMMATQMAKAFAQSTIVPKEYQGNFANGLVAIEMAVRMQTSPLMVMQGLDVIQGRPAWRAQFLIGMVNASGRYDMELQFDEVKDGKGKPFGCSISVDRHFGCGACLFGYAGGSGTARTFFDGAGFGGLPVGLPPYMETAGLRCGTGGF